MQFNVSPKNFVSRLVDCKEQGHNVLPADDPKHDRKVLICDHCGAWSTSMHRMLTDPNSLRKYLEIKREELESS